MVSNENITKLRELTDKICKGEVSDDNLFVDIIKEIKAVIDEQEKDLPSMQSNVKKIKCYENMCSKIKIILEKFKLS